MVSQGGVRRVVLDLEESGEQPGRDSQGGTVTRLPRSPTQRINPDRKVAFRWVGRHLQGHEGDTVASALWGAGVRVVSRSFEYHRPRGIYDLEGEGSSQLVTIDGVPNQSAGTMLLRKGCRSGLRT